MDPRRYSGNALYAARRSALERLPFFAGYGVETGLLIDVLAEVNKTMKLIRREESSLYLDIENIREHERPPMIQIPEYRRLRGLSEVSA